MAVFTLDVSTLGGFDFNYIENIIADRGRSIQLSWSQGGANQDVEILGFSVRAAAAETDAQEAS